MSFRKFLAEIGCKGKSSFSNLHIFWKKFSNNFFLRTFRLFVVLLLPKSECKGKASFFNLQIIFKIFYKNFLLRTFSLREDPADLHQSGCKDEAFLPIIQMFQHFFSYKISSTHGKRCKLTSYKITFQPSPRLLTATPCQPTNKLLYIPYII